MVRLVHKLLATAAVTLVAFIVGALAGPPRNPPVPIAIDGAPPAALTAIDGAWRITVTAWEHPTAAAVTAGILLLPWLLAALSAAIPATKDSQRLFTAYQRQIGFERAGNRCEMEGWIPFVRCMRTASHGDHWHPWSKGGASSLENFVAACATCNTSKGAHVPTFWETQRLTWRRRRYFADGPLRPGQRTGRAAAAR